MKNFTHLLMPVFLIILLSSTTFVIAQAPPGFCPTAQISYMGSPYCGNGGIATVTLTGTAGGKFYSSSDAIALDPSTGDIDLGSSTPGTYQVYYTIDSIDICPVFTTSTSVTINTSVFATINYPQSPYCSNTGYAKVDQQGDAGGVYTADPGLVIDPNTGMVTTAAGAEGTFNVYYTVSNACGFYTATTSITIITSPDASISYGNSAYCSNAGFANVTLTGTSGGTYSSDPGLAINTLTGQIDLAASTPGTYNVNYTVSSGNCTTTATTPVTINAAPSATISYPSSPYCNNGGLASVNLDGTTGGTFSSDPGLAINAASGDVDLAMSTPGTYTVTYQVSANGCDMSTNTSITIVAAPNATIDYPGSPYDNTTGGTASVNLTGDTGGTFSSDPGLAINAASGDVDLAMSAPGTYTVTYTITPSGPCSVFTTTTSITIIGTIIVQSGTNPQDNNDHKPAMAVFPNPVTGNTIGLQLKNLDAGTYTVSFYNNMGQKVYTTLLQHGNDGKSTTTLSLKNLPQGTYEMILRGRNNITVTSRISRN